MSEGIGEKILVGVIVAVVSTLIVGRLNNFEWPDRGTGGSSVSQPSPLPAPSSRAPNNDWAKGWDLTPSAPAPSNDWAKNWDTAPPTSAVPASDSQSIEMKNNTGQHIEVVFYSSDSTFQWPPEGQAHPIQPGGFGSHLLRCRSVGEKICYGAVAISSNVTWGVGRSVRAGCSSNCCTICNGNSTHFSLTN
jgi:hypothetical protein